MQKNSDTPNILIIMTDQQRADTIGALGNSLIKTPAIDSIAKSGTSFTRAYTPAPICSPARVSMMTGIPPHIHRFTDHDWWHWEPTEGPRTGAPHDSAFLENAKEAGYRTFWTGKVHHHGRSWLFDGLDQYAGREAQPSHKTEILDDYSDFLSEKRYSEYLPPSMGRGSEYYMVPQATEAPVEDCRPNWLVDQCIDFLDRRDKEKPFVMHCHFPEPHPPVCNPMPWASLYRAHEMDAPYRPENYKDYQSRTNRYQLRYKCKETAQEDDIGYRIFKAAYYSNISYVDSQIGRLLSALGNERENTLIIFTCDHGEMLGDYGCVGKRCMLEASIRIPLIASWPGHIPENHKCDIPVTLLDIHPTILDALGDAGNLRSAEGASLISVASRDREDAGERLVFSQFSSGWCGQYAVSDGKWKYAYSAPDNKEWLFEIQDGLAESENRIGVPEARPRIKRLKQALMKRHDPVADPYSDAVENGDWKKHTPPAEDYLDDPTFGYLWQERAPEKLQKAVDSLGPGYARKVIKTDKTPSLHALHAVCGGKSPFEG